jgi:hypothetical protein
MIRTSVYAGNHLIVIEVVVCSKIYTSNLLTMYEMFVQHRSGSGISWAASHVGGVSYLIPAIAEGAARKAICDIILIEILSSSSG